MKLKRQEEMLNVTTWHLNAHFVNKWADPVVKIPPLLRVNILFLYFVICYVFSLVDNNFVFYFAKRYVYCFIPCCSLLSRVLNYLHDMMTWRFLSIEPNNKTIWYHNIISLSRDSNSPLMNGPRNSCFNSLIKYQLVLKV